MKTVITILIMAVVVALSGCSQNQTAAFTALTSQNTDLTLRGGVREGDTEIGGVIRRGKSSDMEWGPRFDDLGVYVIFYLSHDVTITDTLDPSLIQPFLESLHAQPYAGLELVGSARHPLSNIRPNWMLGTAFTLAESGENNVALNVEYVDGDQIAGDVSIGIQGLYKF